MTKNENGMSMSYNILNTCPLFPGNICQVVGGYAETFNDLVSNFPESYHRIPLGETVEVLNVDNGDITVSAKFIHLDSREIKDVRQIIERKDLLLLSSNNN
jgi:hypothetical protein